MGKESIYPTKMMLEFAIMGTTPSALFDLHPLAMMVFPIYGIGLMYGSIVPWLTGVIVRIPLLSM